tara:strand:+ start:1811 stop:2107 length:297 start_codon:yes stop_codon:yes gene_type:complete
LEQQEHLQQLILNKQRKQLKNHVVERFKEKGKKHMDGLYICEKLLKLIRERKKATIDTLSHGAISDFVNFKETRARIIEQEYIEQEIKNLLESKENND